jgi:tetratricopeptide (TPR) repeat protein
VTQVLAEIDANAAVRSERPDAPAASATLGLASRLRWRGVLLAAGGAVVLAGALLIARSGPDSGDRARTAGASVKPEKVASRAARAPSKSAQGAPAQTANAPGASVDSTEAAGRDLAQAPARPRLLDEARELVKRARRFRRAGQLDQAEAAYLKALTNLSDYPLAISGLARIYLDRKNAAEAVRWAKQLVQVQPDRSSNHQLLGDAYALAGNHAEAEQAWKRATELASKTARKRP